MSEAVAKIVGFERRVMWRKRLVSLQDGLALAVVISGVIAAALVLLVRLQPLGLPSWAIIIGAMSLPFASALTRWFLTRAREGDAAFLIDKSLDLDDRVATSHVIIERGGATGVLEEALIDDTAERVGNHRAASVVPFRMPRWYALSLVSLIGLMAALMIPQRSLPVTEAATELADIESAGKHLEQSAEEVEPLVPPGTETATLAQEQAELGRGFRRSTATRAEALKRLSALEERIRSRHDDLANTRADEIVSLADQRLGGALSTLSTARRKKPGPDDKSQSAESAQGPASASKGEPNKQRQAATASAGAKSLESSQENVSRSGPANSRPQSPTRASDQRDVPDAKAAGRTKAEPRKRPQEPVSGKEDRKADSAKIDSTRLDPELAKGAAGERGASSDQKPGVKKSTDLKGSGKDSDQNAAEPAAADRQPSELPTGALEALKAVPDSLAEQAAKALPKASEELLKKAAELRANELSPADIEKLRKAAEVLSRDLAQIGQSKDLQRALQEMARQVRPEQIEQVARELGNHEKLKQELEAAARLLSKNQQAKEMVAGLAGQLARSGDDRRQQDTGEQSGAKSNMRDDESRARNQAPRSARADAGAAREKLETAADRRLAGQGRELSLKGKLRQGSGGEYLYLQSKAGAGAARAPYSSAYPQYRREAERSVRQSQVPPGLRSVVRKYFDAINPDSKK